jgi:dihydroorotate dehydrogenase electron transfer subunit
MAVIKSNYAVEEGIYQMEVAWTGDVRPGQFFMLRAWDRDPLLSRPISVHDYDAESGTLSFLYQVKGKGTKLMSELGPMDAIQLDGPHGNGFPDVKSNLVVVGGGMGIAPLLYAVRDFKAKHKRKKVRVYLGYSFESYGVEPFNDVADDVIVNIGGIITEKVEVKRGETVFGCGPNVMMHALADAVPPKHDVYLSLEKRMACGMGVCLGCSIKTAGGSKQVCADGPVFERDELIWEGGL